MTIYEIDQTILSLVDEETGEILDFDAFAQLQMERSQKLEQMALWYKSLTSEAEAIRDEEKRLAERRRGKERRAERLKVHLSEFLQGQAFESPRCEITFRKSKAVEISDEPAFIQWAQAHAPHLLRVKTEVAKSEVSSQLKAGADIAFAQLAEQRSISVK